MKHPGSNMEIRVADRSDLAGLSLLFDEYRQFYGQSSNKDGATEFIEERLLQKDSVIFLAIDNHLPIGFVQLYPSFSSVTMRRIYILNDLFVASMARNKGAASALLKKSEEFASEVGALRLTLATEFRNTRAQALYEKLGWERDETFLYYTKRIAG